MPTTTGLATSFITFSRPGASGGGATVTDRDGKIKWAGHNLLTNSESFDASAWITANITIALPTKAAINAAVAPNGTTTADEIGFPAVTAAGDASIIAQTFTSLDATYTGGVWIKAKAAGDVGKRIAVYINDGSVVNRTFHTVTADWVLVSVTETTGAASTNFTIGVVGSTFGGVNQGAVSVYLWGAHLYRSDMQMQLNPAMPAGMQSYYPTTVRNMLGYTEDFSNNAIWGAGAYGTANSVVGPNGLQTADTIAFTAALKPSISQTISSGIVGGSTYTISVWAKASATGTPATSFRITTNNTAAWSTGVTQKFTLTSSWQRFSVTGVIASSGTAVRVLIGATNLDGSEDSTCLGSVDLYGIQLSDSASLDTYVPVYGAAVTSAAYYAPRLDFDGATLAAKGLLVEELRANVIRGTQAIAGAYWTPSDVTMTAATAVAPDGSTTAARLSPTTTGANRFVYQTKSVTNGIYVSSVYAKAAGFNWFYIVNAPGSAVGAWFNLSTGALGTVAANHTATITAVGNGWYRCTLVGTVAATTVFSQFGVSDADNSSTATASGTNGVHVWGAQLELGSFATSFIPNADASAGATRTADVASVSTSAFPYSGTEGTVVVNWTVLQTSSSLSRLFWLNDTDTGNYVNGITMRQGNATTGTAAGSQLTVRGSNADQAILNVQTPSLVVGSSFKTATAFASADFAACMNGGTVVSQSSGSMPAGLDTLRIGSHQDATYLNGWIRQLTYLPRRISNTELQSRTA